MENARHASQASEKESKREAVSGARIRFEGKARGGEKAEHTR